MKKRYLAISTVLCLIIALFAGCGSGNNPPVVQQSGTSTSTANSSGTVPASPITDGEAPHIVMLFPYNDIPVDVKLVQDEFSRLVQEKIGATVEIEPVTYGTIADRQMLLLASPSEQMDMIMMSARQGFHGAVAKGQLHPLNDWLDQYGSDIKANIDPNSLVNCSINGEIYGIQPNRDLAGQRGFVFRKDLIEDAGITLPENVTDYSQITPVFEQLKAAYPDMYILASNATRDGNYFSSTGKYDQLTDTLGVLEDINNLTVTNLYESKEYNDWAKTVKGWNDAGYLYPDILIDSSNSGAVLMRNGVLACFFDVFKPGAVVEKQTLVGHEVLMVPISNPIRTTNQNWSWTIPSNSKHPEIAMQVINLLYSDVDLINLLCYGIEGTHWELDSDGFVVDGPNGAGYADKKNWATGDGYQAAVQLGNPIDLGSQLKTWNKTAIPSKALGFIFDVEAANMSSEYTALQNVLNEHRTAITWGFVSDVDTALKNFNDALYAAGLENYIKAKQAQLDEWAKNNS